VSVAALPVRPTARPQPPTVTAVYGVGYRLADDARLTILPDV
jgi:hypothetical protein